MRYPVLVQRIPEGGFGRSLTRTEIHDLKFFGVSLPGRAIVVRAYGSDYIGNLYKPANGGYSDIGINVTTK